MNIEDMTIGQIREIAKVAASLGVCGTAQATEPPSPFIGKYVILRTFSAGVHAGVLVSRHGDVAVIKDSRRLWSWTANDGIALSGLAVSGLKAGKIDTLLALHEVIGVIEVIPASDKCEASIRGA